MNFWEPRNVKPHRKHGFTVIFPDEIYLVVGIVLLVFAIPSFESTRVTFAILGTLTILTLIARGIFRNFGAKANNDILDASTELLTLILNNEYGIYPTQEEVETLIFKKTAKLTLVTDEVVELALVYSADNKTSKLIDVQKGIEFV